jgi:cell division protein FtsB
MADLGNLLADFERAIAAQRAEHDQLAADIAALKTRKTQLESDIEKLETVSNREFIQACVRAGIDKNTLDEFRQMIVPNDAPLVAPAA